MLPTGRNSAIKSYLQNQRPHGNSGREFIVSEKGPNICQDILWCCTLLLLSLFLKKLVQSCGYYVPFKSRRILGNVGLAEIVANYSLSPVSVATVVWPFC
jgi:hypothetical protein